VIALIVFDIDGVLTDGRAALTAQETAETKHIHFHDLDALHALKRAGIPLAFLTGESGEMVAAFAARFGVESVISGAKDKLPALTELAAAHNVPLSAVCYVGDSDRDAPALRAAGLGLAPTNATPAAQAAAKRILKARGGEGAAAEAARLVLRLREDAALDLRGEFRRIISESIAAHERLVSESIPTLSAVAVMMIRAIRGGNTIFLFGNGGSAADAQHVAGELVGRFLKESQPFAAIALTTDTSILTAVGNDWAFEEVFSRQVRALAKAGDVVVGISTSGKSPNVIRGLEAAQAKGAHTIGFTGGAGGTMAALCEVCFIAPAALTPRIQELHLVAWHAVCELVEVELMKG